jgi:hypothetical protein
MSGKSVSGVTGAKSLAKSKRRLGLIAAFVRFDDVPMYRV